MILDTRGLVGRRQLKLDFARFARSDQTERVELARGVDRAQLNTRAGRPVVARGLIEYSSSNPELARVAIKNAAIATTEINDRYILSPWKFE